MNKKQLAAVVAGLVAEVAERTGIEESEAQTLVGLYLKRNRGAVLAACGVTEEAAPAAAGAVDQEEATVKVEIDKIEFHGSPPRPAE